MKYVRCVVVFAIRNKSRSAIIRGKESKSTGSTCATTSGTFSMEQGRYLESDLLPYSIM